MFTYIDSPNRFLYVRASKSIPGQVMYDFTAFSLADMAACSADLRKLGADASETAEVGDRIAHYLYDHLIERPTGSRACALVRFFKTCPYGELEADFQLAAQKALGEIPSPATKCLALQGTAGERPEWNERARSRRYKAIPLLSRQFVAQFPMLSQLLHEFGLTLRDVPNGPPSLLLAPHSNQHNVFYVPDAVDSPFLPAQKEFVIPFGIRSVLGFGGLLPSGDVFAAILFSKVPISRQTVELFRTLALSVKLAILPFARRAVLIRRAREVDQIPEVGLSARQYDEPHRHSAQIETLEQLLTVHELAVMTHFAQHQRAEAALQDSEAQLLSVVQSTKDGIVSINARGNITFWNSGAEAMFGYSVQEVMGRPVTVIIPERCREAHRQGVARASAAGHLTVDGTMFELVGLRKDGTEFPVEFSLASWKAKSGAFFTGILRDISERKRTEAALQREVKRTVQQQSALIGLTQSETLHPSDFTTALRQITEKAARVLDVERVGIWLYSEDRQTIRCLDLYELTLDFHSCGMELRAASYPAYFEALAATRVIAADDAARDPRTSEFAQSYISAFGISSLMDVPIHLFGKLAGVVCHEHVGAPRHWEPDEQMFGIAISNLIALSYEQWQRKWAEEALRESKERFTGAFNHAAIGMALVAPDGRFLDVNGAMCRIVGYSREELLETTFQAITYPEDLEASLAYVRRTLAGEIETFHMEKRYIRKSTRIVWVQLTVALVHDRQGQSPYFIAQAVDITDRKRTEESLQKSEHRYRTLVEAARDVIFGLTPDGIITSLNPAFERATEFSASEWIGKPFSSLLHPDDVSRATALLSGIIAQGHARPATLRLRTKQDRLVMAECAASPQFERGRLVAILGIARDITERVMMQEALVQAERQYRSIFEHAVEGMFQTTLTGQFLTANPALARLLGYTSPEEMIAAVTDITHQIYLDPDRRDEFRRSLEDNDSVTGFESQVCRRDGSIVWITESARVRRDTGGEVVGYEGSVENITARKLAEERVQSTLAQIRKLASRLEKVREEERARIARELHDELGVGLTCLKIDLSRLFPQDRPAGGRTDEKVHRIMGQIDDTIATVQRIVTELRPAILDDLGLVAAIEWQAEDFQRRTGIECVFSLGSEDPPVTPEQATSVFRICQEALTNVARHAGATTATIRLHDQDDGLLLEVQDNGCGIAPEKITDFRSLGLLGMRERAGLFGGMVTVIGRPGEGTVVSLRIPADRSASSPRNT